MLTPAQLATLLAAFNAQTDPAFVAARAEGNVGAMVDFYNGDSTFIVWRTTTPASAVMDAILWANFTPQDAPDGTQAWANRSLACQGKQFNVQTLLTGREQIASNRPSIRAGLQDALTAIPSGAGGATKGGGWNGVASAMQRPARRFEALYATGTGTAAVPGELVVDGPLSIEEAIRAIALN